MNYCAHVVTELSRQLSERRVRSIEADDASLCEGFHAFEVDEEFRWTNGNALLPASLSDGLDDALGKSSPLIAFLDNAYILCA